MARVHCQIGPTARSFAVMFAATFAATFASVTSARSGRSVEQLDRSSHACKSVDPSEEALCGDAQLLARSYKLLPRWPFDGFRLVMEMSNGTCDFYRAPKLGRPSFCCDIQGDYRQPEIAVREAIGSFLVGCNRRPAGRPCRALDLGANNGWFSAYMLQLGAHVVSVEPQPAFAQAIEATAKLNCWKKRSTVINARACTSREVSGARPFITRDAKPFSGSCYIATNTSSCEAGGGFREGGGSSQLRTVYGHECAAKHGLPATVGGIPLRSVLLEGAQAEQAAELQRKTNTATIPSLRVELDLVKIDVDGPERYMMQEIDDLMTSRLLSIRTIIVEASFVTPSQMFRLQHRHGYTAYRLDAHDGRRRMTRSGWDAFSPGRTIARLDRFASKHREADRAVTRFSPHNPDQFKASNGASAPDHPKGLTPAGDDTPRVDLEEELFGVRAMRHVYRAKPNLSLQAWTTLMQPIQHQGYESAPLQWVLTLEGDLTEPVDTLIQPWIRVTPEYKNASATGILPAYFADGARARASSSRQLRPPARPPARSPARDFQEVFEGVKT